MNVILYFGGAIAAGVLTSATCALFNWLGSKNYPSEGSDDVNDNRITKKRLGWLFGWVIQGVIGGFVVSFLFAEYVLRDGGTVGIVWALAFVSGSVSWLNFKESTDAIKQLIQIVKDFFK
ncbi:hypothetical protein [Aliivibrio finisterrensis]|uniref:Lipoprotein n=1 Tax=Aliivibrio finisterrensis TaxID=511998 RepID=A0ABY0I4U8_9GAMM|nr:hypothetical protein [Aliivibrio finisterrensis]RYU63782.1 hypothetical protein ERW53_12125 [Aliivibrio finisterrensis]RYU82718.1 hypothetical protein ERW52_13950 [Aliivibrio finisterrensis]